LLIAPGFIDTHVHYVQTGSSRPTARNCSTGSIATAFPAEMAFADPRMPPPWRRCFATSCYATAPRPALVFCAVYPQSVAALFAEAERRGMRIAAGKVLMDRNAPEKLRDTAQQGYDDSKALIARWHGRARCL